MDASVDDRNQSNGSLGTPDPPAHPPMSYALFATFFGLAWACVTFITFCALAPSPCKRKACARVACDSIPFPWAFLQRNHQGRIKPGMAIVAWVPYGALQRLATARLTASPRGFVTKPRA